MKNKFLIILITSLVSYACSAQKTEISVINNNQLKETLINIESYSNFIGSILSLNIYKLNNGSGSAHLKESDEVSFNYLITVSEFDEIPNSSLYSIGPFVNPKILDMEDLGKKIIFTIEAGFFKKRKKYSFAIFKDKIESY